MKKGDLDLKRTFARIAAALQVCIGALLLVGTIGLSLTAYRTIREETMQFGENLSAAAVALDSLRDAYAQSASNLFGLTRSMDDVAEKLVGVSGAVSETGRRFENYGRVEESPFLGKLKPFTEWFKNSGEKLREVGGDVGSVSTALKRQSEAIKSYRVDGHEKTLDAIAKTAESLGRTKAILDNSHSVGLWCGFVCILGFCVSMLFFTNGVLLCVLARSKS